MRTIRPLRTDDTDKEVSVAMCMSPHEMTSARIEELLAKLREYERERPGVWGWRISEFEQLLKERAENGTYLTAGVIDNHTHRRRI